MMKISLAMMGLALVSSAAIAEDCVAPDAPAGLPDGATASMEEMLEGQKTVKAFQAANLDYMKCLEPQIEAATPAATADDASDEAKDALKALEESYNAAVSQEEELAGQFNTEIREYKAANPQ